jgi:DNA uptake protein ComE-like DNA-binding protein
MPQFLTLLDSWPNTNYSNYVHIVGDADGTKIWRSASEEVRLKQSSFKNYPQFEGRKPYKSNVIVPVPGSLHLNSMDSVDFEKLPVFGPVLSSRTVKFRTALGGFIYVSQLKEVYGIDDEAFDKIKSWFDPSLSPVSKLCADSASWTTLKRHPYIGFEGARMIERYRKHHKLNAIDDLSLMPQMDDSLWGVWSPYLKICSN